MTKISKSSASSIHQIYNATQVFISDVTSTVTRFSRMARSVDGIKGKYIQIKCSLIDCRLISFQDFVLNLAAKTLILFAWIVFIFDQIKIILQVSDDCFVGSLLRLVTIENLLFLSSLVKHNDVVFQSVMLDFTCFCQLSITRQMILADVIENDVNQTLISSLYIDVHTV